MWDEDKFFFNRHDSVSDSVSSSTVLLLPRFWEVLSAVWLSLFYAMNLVM